MRPQLSDGVHIVRLECTIAFPLYVCLYLFMLRMHYTIESKGVCNKKWTGHSNIKFSINIGPTEAYYITNQRKLNENLAELCRLEIAALIG